MPNAVGFITKEVREKGERIGFEVKMGRIKTGKKKAPRSLEYGAWLGSVVTGDS